ncbi:hypothetical protein R80B4_01873 [Fibrobacteres bacterium R8-0-B4]
MSFITRQGVGRLLLAAVVTVGAVGARAQTWNCGKYGDNVTATRSGETLTISGKGEMKDFVGANNDFGGDRPWHESRGTITKVIIKDGVTTIGNRAFYEFVALTSVSIPNSVISIGGYAFGGCTATKSIEVAAGNVNYSSEDGVLFNKSKTNLIYCPRDKGGAYTIPNSVTSVGNEAFVTGAFSACKNLTSVIIPNSVTSVRASSFWGCTGLTSVTIGNGVTEIEKETFSGCASLKSIIIPNNINAIKDSAFAGCVGLTSATLGNRVTKIGSSVFEDCISLESVAITDGVSCIGKEMFSGCIGLKSVTIPNSVTIIGEWAFIHCTGLESIVIPSSVTSIGGRLFLGCTNLKSITSLNPVPPNVFANSYGNGWRLGEENTTCLYVPSSSIQAYKSARSCGQYCDTPWDFKCIKGIGQQETIEKTIGSFTDPRNGQKYRTATIGGKAWMAQNLNYQTGNSRCYDNDNSNCEKYGRLYDWNTAKSACPKGWHLPSRLEWNDLASAVGGVTNSGTRLKSTTGWKDNGNGTDDFGFSALPVGIYSKNGTFGLIGAVSFWWTASIYSSGFAYIRDMSYEADKLGERQAPSDNGFSVRCIAD